MSVQPYELLCALAEQRGWKLRLGLVAKERLALGRLGPPRIGEHSLLADLILVRPEGAVEAPNFLGAGNLQEAASDILAILEHEGVFKS